MNNASILFFNIDAGKVRARLGLGWRRGRGCSEGLGEEGTGALGRSKGPGVVGSRAWAQGRGAGPGDASAGAWA